MSHFYEFDPNSPQAKALIGEINDRYAPEGSRVESVGVVYGTELSSETLDAIEKMLDLTSVLFLFVNVVQRETGVRFAVEGTSIIIDSPGVRLVFEAGVSDDIPKE